MESLSRLRLLRLILCVAVLVAECLLFIHHLQSGNILEIIHDHIPCFFAFTFDFVFFVLGIPNDWLGLNFFFYLFLLLGA